MCFALYKQNSGHAARPQRLHAARHLGALLGLLCAGLLCAGAAVAEIRPLTADTFPALQAEHAGRPFLVGLWSVDCPPCRAELALFGELKRADPSFPLVLIATDSVSELEEAAAVLAHYELDEVVSWMFADGFVERLRHSIDPTWYGELPRSYFYAADGSVRAHSGVLTRAVIEANLPDY